MPMEGESPVQAARARRTAVMTCLCSSTVNSDYPHFIGDPAKELES